MALKKITQKFDEIKKNVLVRDIMSTSIISIDSKKTAKDAADLMAKNKISTVIITHGGRFSGIVTERDMIKRVIHGSKDPKKTELYDIMTKDPRTIGPDAPIRKAGYLMKKFNVRKLIVKEDGEIVGIISQTDIISSMNKIYKSYQHLMWNPLVTLFLFIMITLLFILNIVFFSR